MGLRGIVSEEVCDSCRIAREGSGDELVLDLAPLFSSMNTRSRGWVEAVGECSVCDVDEDEEKGEPRVSGVSGVRDDICCRERLRVHRCAKGSV